MGVRPIKKIACLLITTTMIFASVLSSATVSPNDTLYPDQWHLPRIDAPEAWDLDDNDWYTNTGSNDIIVAVIDDGLYWSDLAYLRHVDFKEDIIWKNPNEGVDDANGDGYPGIAWVDDDGDGLVDEGTNGISRGDTGYDNNLPKDDDENGFEDDFYGWDFNDNDNDIYCDSDELNLFNHGSKVTSHIIATINNILLKTLLYFWQVKIFVRRYINSNN